MKVLHKYILRWETVAQLLLEQIEKERVRTFELITQYSLAIGPSGQVKFIHNNDVCGVLSNANGSF